MSLPMLYHSPDQMFECLTTKPDGFGSIMATCHHATVECEKFTAKYVAAVIATKLALFDEMRAALRIQVQNYWQTPDDNAKFRALLAKVDAIAKDAT